MRWPFRSTMIGISLVAYRTNTREQCKGRPMVCAVRRACTFTWCALMGPEPQLRATRGGVLFGQTSDTRVGFWLRRVLALIAGDLVVHFLPVGVICRGARPRRQIFRRTAEPCRYVVRHMVAARCESGRDNYQCKETSHGSVRESWRRMNENAPPTGEWAAGLSNRGGEETTAPHAPSLRRL
jgi:hypothetical protein